MLRVEVGHKGVAWIPDGALPLHAPAVLESGAGPVVLQIGRVVLTAVHH
jgi:hypothetical protein